MKVWGMWYGGSSYVVPDQFRRGDIDEARSIKALKEMFQDRYENNSYPETPCVTNDSEMWVFFTDPYQHPDLYPDRIMRFGPRGGVIIERA